MKPVLPPLALPIRPDDTLTQAEPGQATIVQTRLIRAPRERVWQAWTDAGHLGQWWGPQGFSVTTQLFEFRVGGHWVFTMHGPDPEPNSATPGGPRDFPNHIVWTRMESALLPGGQGLADAPWVLEYHHVDAEHTEAVVFKSAVRFEAQGEHTLLTLHADLGSVELRDRVIRDFGAAQGGRETLARLAHQTEGEGGVQTEAALGHRLVLCRELPVRRELLWRAWTEPALLQQWFCPKPYAVDDCQMELRAGGRFFTHMVGPDGFAADNEGSFLEVVPLERLSFTDLLLADWVPAPQVGLGFTAVITFEDAGPGRTRYTATARHASAASRAQHAQMGFFEGWGTATDQLVELAKTLPVNPS